MSSLELRHGILADSDCLKEYINRQKVEELEKIKKELDGKVMPKDVCIKDGKIVFRSVVDEIIDNHIKELKEGINND